jgi:hypothetical protein
LSDAGRAEGNRETQPAPDVQPSGKNLLTD